MKIEAKPFPALDAEKLPGGLIPAVIQDDRTLQVLMLGYMNREAYEKSGMIFTLRDRILADKAMDAIYAKAQVKEVEPKAAEKTEENN